MQILTVFILGLLIVCVVDGSVIPDEALTASLQDVWNEDEFIIALSNITAKKPSTSNDLMETLLVINYKQMEIKLMLDRQTKYVTLETLDKKNCQLSVSSVEMNFTTMNTPPKSLVFQVYQYAPTQNVSYMEVYVDCLYRGSIPFNKTFRDITETKDRPAIRVFRQQGYQAKVYHSNNIFDALNKEECSKSMTFVQVLLKSVIHTYLDLNKIHFTNSNGCDQENEFTDQSDRINDYLDYHE